uniref:Uncharacterized protein n=1 Tax=Oryza sativa subsp. japonica TaxID=39947 RepID=Q5VP61_ORYSJ|nr:hypothetical protein [Oryza sativa Japonica Group]BAD68764.1 hypothetical protein [Oryza sativa Japonica Group]
MAAASFAMEDEDDFGPRNPYDDDQSFSQPTTTVVGGGGGEAPSGSIGPMMKTVEALGDGNDCRICLDADGGGEAYIEGDGMRRTPVSRAAFSWATRSPLMG